MTETFEVAFYVELIEELYSQDSCLDAIAGEPCLEKSRLKSGTAEGGAAAPQSVTLRHGLESTRRNDMILPDQAKEVRIGTSEL